jgi:hypothetical protein
MRHVWKKKNASLKICKYCDASKHFVTGARGGKVITYSLSGSKKTSDTMPECVAKDYAAKGATKAEKTPKVKKSTKRLAPTASLIAGMEVHAVPPILFNTHVATRQLGFATEEAFLEAVASGDINAPLEGNRWTKDDLSDYVSKLKTRRVAAKKLAEEQAAQAEADREAAEKLAAETATALTLEPETAPAA